MTPRKDCDDRFAHIIEWVVVAAFFALMLLGGA